MFSPDQNRTQFKSSSKVRNILGRIRAALSRYLEVQARVDNYH